VVLTAGPGDASIQTIATFAPLTLARRERRFRTCAGFALSLFVHCALLLILINRDASFGELERLPVLLVKWVDDAGDTHDARAANTPTADTSIREQTQAEREQEAVPERAEESLAATLTASNFDPEVIEPPLIALEIEEPAAAEIPPVDQPSILSPQTNRQAREPRKIDISPLQQLALEQRVVAAAQTLHDGESSELSWNEDGRTYQAILTRNPALGSMDLEQVTVEVTTATDSGARLRTQLTMKRLAFSQFSQVIDRWDPQVQMHDDEIVGRFHSNSSFFIAPDSSAIPKFSGKVTTAARGFRTSNGGLRRRREEVFQGGIQTFTGRIELPKEARPFAIEPDADDAHVHRFIDDAHIVFHEDGRYAWRDRKADVEQLARYPENRPSYFIAGPDATLYVKGTVNGKVLVYSPERVVIEGSLNYADNPRTNADADDYLGLVSDKYVEIARPYVTGRGDLHIDAAIFARRRFTVTNIDFGRTALLSIYGSLTSGTISATEPRYATKIEFDPRLDRLRPPGFPATNRYEVARVPDTWTEVEEHAAL
jgi:hypothetical protein